MAAAVFAGSRPIVFCIKSKEIRCNFKIPEDDAYVVDVPELPGYMAHGATRQDAIKFWIKTA